MQDRNVREMLIEAQGTFSDIPFRRVIPFCLTRPVPLLSGAMIRFNLTRAATRLSHGEFSGVRPACLLLGLALLGGCAGGDGSRWSFGARQGVADGQAATPAAVTLDPIAAFAAQAQPGATRSVTTADGRAATVRLVRSYQAASGRPCREVLVGSGMAERSQVVCQREDGAWVPARPLLRGGGVARR
jgi:hypothetical protein